MKREIKFRAYSIDSGTLYTWEDISSLNNLQKLLSLNHVQVMQYTGLKDKNGKEIYEGDIVIHASRNGMKPHNIVFHKGCFMGDYGLLYPLHQENLNEDCEIEVIGNIYENPELLNQKS